jgi:monoamine oxidase
MPIAKRRTFLKLALLSAPVIGTGAWTWPARWLSSEARKKEVVIVGAGLAGLVAGYELTKSGHDVTILEAQLRSGGRVQTIREPFSDGLYAEAGAARIPDNHELTLRYAKHFGLTLVPFYPKQKDRVFLLGGKRIRVQAGADLDLSQVPFVLTPEERTLGMSGLAKKYMGNAVQQIGDPTLPGWLNGPAKAYDNFNMAEYLKKQGASEGAIRLLELPVATPEDDPASLLWDLRESRYESHETTRYKIEGGNDSLPKAFAAKLSQNIRYGCPVVRIEQDSTKVRATVSQAGTHHTFEADRLICTVPFPVLRKVEVSPKFSEAKRKAIDELAYDTITRVVLQCRTRYWEKDGYNGFGISDLPQEIWHPTFDQPGTRGLLVSYMYFALGRRVGAMSEEDRLTFVSREMDKVHPGLFDNLEGHFSKVWAADPWAGGAAAIPSPGQMSTCAQGLKNRKGEFTLQASTHPTGLGGCKGRWNPGCEPPRKLPMQFPKAPDCEEQGSANLEPRDAGSSDPDREERPQSQPAIPSSRHCCLR